MAVTASLSGTLLDALGNAVVGGTITISLDNFGSNVPYVSGTGTIVTAAVTVKSIAAGAWTATVFGNDVITPAGTVYSLIFADANAKAIASGVYRFNANGTYNINSTAPNVTYPIPVAVGAVNANKLQGITVKGTTPLNAQVLTYVAANGDWEAATPSGGGVPGGTPGQIQFNNAGAFGGVSQVPLANGGTGVDLSASGGTTSVLAQDAAHNITARALIAADIPNLDASKITTSQLALARGGTNADLSATGGASNFLRQNSVGGNVTVVQPAFTDISGAATTGQIPSLDFAKITTGIVPVTQGGTGVTLAATGGASNVLKQVTVGANVTVGQLAFTDISGTATTGQVPNLDAAKITTGQLALARGGTNADLSATGGASNFLRQNSVGATVTVVQPAFTDISGAATTAQIPALDFSKITTGIVPIAQGGTGVTLAATGGASNVLKQVTVGANVTVGQLAFTDISGAAVAGQVPNLDAGKITTGQLALARGGTNADLSGTGGASNFLRQNSVGANVTVVQPAFTDISGTATTAQIPNLDFTKITTGIVPVAQGGTGVTLAATGGASNVLKQVTVGANVTVGQLAFTDISGAAVAAQIPNLDFTKITTGIVPIAQGGTGVTLAATGGASNVLKQVSVGANVTVGQLAFTDVSGTATTGQIPALDFSKITTGIVPITQGGTGVTLAATGGASNVLKQVLVGGNITVGQLGTSDISWAQGTASAFATRQATLPLTSGEQYFATDLQVVYIGTPGIGIGYITIGDTTQVNETMRQVLATLEACRKALVVLAVEGNKARDTDFIPINDVDSGSVT